MWIEWHPTWEAFQWSNGGSGLWLVVILVDFGNAEEHFSGSKHRDDQIKQQCFLKHKWIWDEGVKMVG